MNERQKKMICTRCPMGCEMDVLLEAKGEINVNGSVCKLGKEYARDEMTNPTRTITTTVKVKNGVYSLVPVRTTIPVPKNRITDVMKELRKLEVAAPVKINQVLIKNILGLGADIETCSDVSRLPQTELKLPLASNGSFENFSSDSFQKKMEERISNSAKQADTTKKVIIGSKILSQTAFCFKELFGDKATVLVADKNTYAAAGKAVMEILISSGKKNIYKPLIIEDKDLCAEHRFVKKVTEYLGSADGIPLAVGSGTINDLVKLSACNCKRPYMAVATAGSMDGYTAFGASITKDGFKQTMVCPAPAAVLADIDIIEKAPEGMNSSGYADLIAKIPAGADWIIADALGIEKINEKAWLLIQPHLREWTGNPSGIKNRDKKTIMMLMEGLIMSGLAMQAAKSSRPASGAEHQFSHLWDNEHLVHNGSAPPHGFKVGIGSICSESIYEKLLTLEPQDIETDIEIIKKRWPKWEVVEDTITGYFKEPDLVGLVIKESKAKYINAGKLSERLKLLRSEWPQIKLKLKGQLLGAEKIQEMIKTAGAPSLPTDIGIDYGRLSRCFRYAQMIRKRYTILDVVLESGLWKECIDSLFLHDGFWGNGSKKVSSRKV